MDPISAVGLASAVAGLGDVISRSISSLLDLQSRYRSVDLKVNLLIGQLSTLKTALSQIAELNAKLSTVPQHEQLVQNLATSLGCCEILILHLDDRLCSSQRHGSYGLDAFAKIQFLRDEKTITEYLNLLNNQINALNLLLTALQ
jgi:guanine nucleotide-binding protein G(i) subunit alpha